MLYSKKSENFSRFCVFFIEEVNHLCLLCLLNLIQRNYSTITVKTAVDIITSRSDVDVSVLRVWCASGHVSVDHTQRVSLSRTSMLRLPQPLP